MYKMKKSAKRKCKRTKHKCTTHTHHMHKKTHHKRLRSQRGGTIESEYDKVIERYIQCTDPTIQLAVRKFFNNCEIFKTLLELRDAETPTLKNVVCAKFTDVQIRKVETVFILSASKKFPLIKTKLEIEWPNFVIHLTQVVLNSYQKEKDAEIDARLRDLKGLLPAATKAQVSSGAAASNGAAARLSSGAVASGAVASGAVASGAVASGAVASGAVDTREEAPPGWTLKGNVWKGPNGAYVPANFFKPPPN
jgi:hypothetical protein